MLVFFSHFTPVWLCEQQPGRTAALEVKCGADDDAGKAGQSGAAFGTSACLCWFKVYVTNSLWAVWCCVLSDWSCQWKGRSHSTAPSRTVSLLLHCWWICGCRVSCQCADLINILLSSLFLIFKLANWFRSPDDCTITRCAVRWGGGQGWGGGCCLGSSVRSLLGKQKWNHV